MGNSRGKIANRNHTAAAQRVVSWFFPFCPCERKATQLYSGFGYEQIVKMA